MKKKKVISGLVVVMAVIAGLFMAGCLGPGSEGGGDSNSGGNPFVGTWHGYDWDGDPMTLIVDQTTWTAYYRFYYSSYQYTNMSESGTYTYSGNTAIFYYEGYTGTGTVSGNTLTANLTALGYGTIKFTR